MTGDALSCSLRFNHVVIISNGSFKTLFVELKPNALICHVRNYYLVNEIVGSADYLCKYHIL